MLVGVIAAGEIGFWVLLLGGLALRYLARAPRAGMAVLIGVPLVDLVLLVVTVVDLRSGATAGTAHGLAAVYIGFSVAFGHGIIRWADQRFAHRFAGGPPPVKPPKYGRGRARYEWREWGKAVVAAGIAAGLLLGMAALVGHPERTSALVGWLPLLGKIVGIWLLFPVAATVWPRRAPRKQEQ